MEEAEEKIKEVSEQQEQQQTRLETSLALKADRLMDVLQLLVVYLLVLLFGIGVYDLGVKLFSFVTSGKIVEATNVIAILDTALLLFLVVEVFRTSVAHLEDKKVLPLVIDVAIIGVVRSLITFRVEQYTQPLDALLASSSYALTLVVLIGGYYIVHRQERKPLDKHPHEADDR
ncbi:MAG: phosphate-starvation-inducible PsiE family protein [Candidatus Nanohaloarchaea archaeon]